MMTVTSEPSWRPSPSALPACDRRHDLLPTDVHDHLGHDRAELHGSHRPLQLIPRADLHPVPPSDRFRRPRSVPLRLRSGRISTSTALNDAQVTTPSRSPSRSTDARVTSATSGGALAMRTRARSPSTEIDVTRPCTTLRADPSGRSSESVTSDGTEQPDHLAALEPFGPGGDDVALVRDQQPCADLEGLEDPAERVHADEVGGVARPRRGADLLGGPGLRHAAVLEQHETLGEDRRLDRVVRHDHPDAREARELVSDELPDAHARADVERRERFVQEQQARLDDQGASERDPLRLAAGEVARSRVGAVRETEPLEEPGRAFGALPVSARRALGAGTRRSRSPTGAGTAAGPGRPRRSAVARAGRGRRSRRRPGPRRRA